ncbi:MAG: hypothetical protein AB1633_01725 [Elusimicrobiota bacterium]
MITGFIFPIYGISIFYEGLLVNVCLINFLNMSCIYFIINGKETLLKRFWILAGVFFGLSTLCRPNIYLFLPFIFLWTLFTIENHRDIFLCNFFLLVGILFVATPLLIRNLIIANDFSFTSSSWGINFYMGATLGSKESPFKILGTIQPIKMEEKFKKMAENNTKKVLSPEEVSKFWLMQAFDFIKNNKNFYIALLKKKFFLFFNQYEIPSNYDFYFFRKNYSSILNLAIVNFGFIATSGIAGMILSVKKWKNYLLLYFLILIYIISSLTFFILAEYRFPIVPILIVFSSVVIHNLVEMKRIWKVILLLFPIYIFVHQDTHKVPFTGVHTELAKIYYSNGNIPSAIIELNKEIEKFPNFIPAKKLLQEINAINH